MKKLLFIMMLIVLCSFASADYVDDMNSQSVVYYKLEETAQPYVDEVAGINLVSGTDPDRVAGIIDYGQDFDVAGSERIYTAKTEALEQDYMAVSFWYTHTPYTTAQVVYDIGGRGYNYGFAYLVQRSNLAGHENEGNIGINTNDGTYSGYTGKIWANGETAHVFDYYNGTHLVEMINCTETFTLPVTNTIKYAAGTNTEVLLGDWHNGASTFEGFYLNGQIDEFWYSGGTYTNYTEVCEFLFNEGSPTSNQQYPFPANNNESKWINKIPINCSEITDGTPIVVNGSSGWNDEIIWTQCKSDLYLYWNSTSNYIIGNTTNKFPFEVESGLGTSFVPTLVWDSTYEGVWHKNGTDSTSVGIDATAITTSDDSNGIVDGTQRYDSSNSEFINFGDEDAVTGNAGLTVEAWYYRDADTGTTETIISKWWDGSNRAFTLWLDNDKPTCRVSTDTQNDNDQAQSATTPAVDAWTYLGCTWGSGNIKTWEGNGTNSDTQAQAGNTVRNNNADFEHGSADSAGVDGNYAEGMLDEIRVSNVARDSDYFSQVYSNIYNVKGYGSLGENEPLGGDVIANITDINCTSPVPDDTTEPFWTNDDTPTYSITTDYSAGCKINGSWCATTNATHHVCTQPSALDEGLVDIYLSCNSTTGNVSTFSYQNYIDTINPNGTITSPTASQQYNQTILSTITISVVFEDRTDVNNISCLINGTTNATNSSPINNTVWNWEFTPSAFTDYVVDCYAWDNVSTYNQGSTGLTAFSFFYTLKSANLTYGTNISGMYFYPNLSNYNISSGTITELNDAVENQTETNYYISVCHNGTVNGSLVGWVNETSTTHQIKCATSYTGTKINMSTSNSTFNSSFIVDSCNSIWCWLDWNNASSGYLFTDYWEVG